MRSFSFPSFSFLSFLSVLSRQLIFSFYLFLFFFLASRNGDADFQSGFQAGSRWFDTSPSGSKSTSMVGRRARRTRASRRQDNIITIPLGGCDLHHQHPPPAPSSPTSPSPIRRLFKYAISSPTLAPCLLPKKQALLMEMPNSSLGPSLFLFGTVDEGG